MFLDVITDFREGRARQVWSNESALIGIPAVYKLAHVVMFDEVATVCGGQALVYLLKKPGVVIQKSLDRFPGERSASQPRSAATRASLLSNSGRRFSGIGPVYRRGGRCQLAAAFLAAAFPELSHKGSFVRRPTEAEHRSR